jgi:hypothetical protein
MPVRGEIASSDHHQAMMKELEKIAYFRDPSFKHMFHMERSTFQVSA